MTNTSNIKTCWKSLKANLTTMTKIFRFMMMDIMIQVTGLMLLHSIISRIQSIYSKI